MNKLTVILLVETVWLVAAAFIYHALEGYEYRFLMVFPTVLIMLTSIVVIGMVFESSNRKKDNGEAGKQDIIPRSKFPMG